MLSVGVLLGLGIVAAVFMAVFIGANDIANAMGPLIGSGAMRLLHVLILAAVFEFIGSVLLGGFVSNTVSGKLLRVTLSPGVPMDTQVREYMLVMVSVLVGSGSWLCIATILSLPVSTTHSVIGSVVGCGIFMAGWGAVDWVEMGKIAGTWVASPIIGGVVSLVLWFLLKRYVMTAKDPVQKMLFSLPILSAATLGVLVLFLLYKGLSPFNLNVPLYIALPATIVIVVASGVLVWKFFIPIVKRRIDREMSDNFAELQEKGISEPTEDPSDKELPNTDHEELLQKDTDEDHDNKAQVEDLNLSNVMTSGSDNDDRLLADIRALAENERKGIEIAEKHIFHLLVIMTSASIALAHGANDISNASGPLAAIVYSFKTHELPSSKTTTAFWVTVVTAAGLILGLSTMGYRVMMTIGHKITKLTPSRAFVSQLSTATITLSASLLGLPLSTTHIVVGCIYGISIVDMKSVKDLQWKLILGIVLSWIITIPASALMTLAVFFITRFIL